ncbi:MAG TPA: lysylphosphatidylglycerol synthase domain-containing protein [Dongiaceae bacterium]|nr:lysylphosphatidylglycerol synthase domain-containing protein [Dongiaceae bacterium]
MSLRAVAGLLVGLIVIIAILSHQDLPAIWNAIRAAGWGLVPALGWRSAAIVLAASAWRSLFMRRIRPQAIFMMLARWIGESVNTLLPVGQVGGDVVRGRLLRHDLVLADHATKSVFDPATGTSTSHGSHGHGIAGGISIAATVIADITLNLFAQLLFALPGLALLWYDGALTDWQSLVCLALAILPCGLVVLGQSPAVVRLGSSLARRLGLIKQSASDQSGGLGFDLAVGHLYRRYGTIATAMLWHLLAWVCRTGETWMVLRLLGSPVNLLEASVVETLLGAVRVAAFVMPAGLGVQEGALILLCGWIGVPAAPAFAMALIKRGRELALGLPGLLAWIVAERRLRRRHRAALHSPLPREAQG